MHKTKQRIYLLWSVGRQVLASQESWAPSRVAVTQEDKCVTMNVPSFFLQLCMLSMVPCCVRYPCSQMQWAALAASPQFFVHPSLVGGVRSKKGFESEHCLTIMQAFLLLSTQHQCFQYKSKTELLTSYYDENLLYSSQNLLWQRCALEWGPSLQAEQAMWSQLCPSLALQSSPHLSCPPDTHQ